MPYKFNPFTGELDYYETGVSGSGDVVGPVSAVDSNIALYDGVTGKLIKDGGYSPFSFDLAGASATVQSNLDTHTSETTTAHGGIVASNDPVFDTVSFLNNESIDRTSTGMLYGGVLTNPTGITISISAPGAGYINDSVGIHKKLEWSSPLTVDTVADGINYIVVDQSGTAIAITSYPTASYLYCGYVLVGGGNSFIYDVFSFPNHVSQFTERLQIWNTYAVGNLVMTGSLVSERADPNFLELNISEGYMFCRFVPYYTAQTTEFTKLYNSSEGLQIDFNDLYHVNTSQWNDVTQTAANALVTMTDGYWKKDLIVQLPNGHVYCLFSTSEYASQDLAAMAEVTLGSLSSLTDVTMLSVIISQKGDTTVAQRIRDIRPYMPKVFHQEFGQGQDHSTFTHLDYASSGHTGFSPAAITNLRGKNVPTPGAPENLLFLQYNDTSGEFQYGTTSGSGDVTGPASSTNEAVVLFNGTSGKVIKNSSVTVNTSGTINIPTGQTYNINGSAHGHTEAQVAFDNSTGHTHNGTNSTATAHEGLSAPHSGHAVLANIFTGLANIKVGLTAPSSPAVGDLWVDTN